ncbi:putative protease YrrO [Propionispora sp. 2/2-37]|uniref:peptidase U32 family protein n=1 Tax=Propionispora sp. 2/2-37 TaxID=1677858 RepID=UPI0006C3E519|nr:U32 family peptidase [Propionispora sp. 2/2-37]CUH97426.1 putative protease YrrO [Propionispora sp. 2/2-37]
MHIPELLAPAGNLEKCKMALLYGADAVYMGGKDFGLRAFGGNLNDNELQDAVRFAHSLKKKAYVTVNIFPYQEDLIKLPDYIEFLSQIAADAVIVSDLGVFRLVRDIAPEMAIHVSTQANNINWSSVLAWQEMGASRVVLARELSLADIEVIRSKANIELEAFVHGAMCISYSGRCLLSNYFTGRDANHGECAQPCRWKYSLVEEKRPGQYFPVMEDGRGTYIFNSKDLCLLPYLPQLVQAGIDSFKIEGRMKSIHYVATVVKAYREALDSLAQDPQGYHMKSVWQEELNKVSHREYTSGFYFKKTTEADQIYGSSSYTQTHDFIGLIHSYQSDTGVALVEQRNHMKVGDIVEIAQPGCPNFTQKIEEMFDSEGNAISAAPHPQQMIRLPVKQAVVPYAMIRRKVRPS